MTYGSGRGWNAGGNDWHRNLQRSNARSLPPPPIPIHIVEELISVPEREAGTGQHRSVGRKPSAHKEVRDTSVTQNFSACGCVVCAHPTWCCRVSLVVVARCSENGAKDCAFLRKVQKNSRIFPSHAHTLRIILASFCCSAEIARFSRIAHRASCFIVTSAVSALV